jgi:hypothetical protein
MRVRGAVFPAVAGYLVVLAMSHGADCSSAHDPGQEFTYLRMFSSNPGHSDRYYDRGAGMNEFAHAVSISSRSATPAETRRLGRKESRQRHSQRPRVSRETTGDSQSWDTPTTGFATVRGGGYVLSETRQRTNPMEEFVESTEDSQEGNEDDKIDDEARPNFKTSVRLIKNESRGIKTFDDDLDKDATEVARVVHAIYNCNVSKPLNAQFEGISRVKDGEDIKRVSFMLMRILQQYKIKSFVDVPCRAHASWMHNFLSHALMKIPDLRYICVDTNREILKAVRQRVGEGVNARFVLRQFWTDQLPKADLVFSWSGLDGMRRENVVKFMMKVANSDRHKYFIVGSHGMDSRTAQSKATPINVRQAPFNLPQPMRVISQVSVGSVKKQMYIYKPDGMRGAHE